MKAIVCTQYGTPDVLQLQELDRPVPKENEVLIRTHAAAVTAAGLIGRKGLPLFTRLFSGWSRPKHSVLGMEIAGKIERVGTKVSRFNPGDQIFGITGLSLGANAEYTTVSEDAAIILKPNFLSYQEAVAVVEGGLTALNFLVNNGKVRPGQKVLVYGASGSVGTASVQLAKSLGAEVTGVCSTVNMELVKSLGAAHVIDYTREDFTRNGERYDIIFDTVGKRSFPACRNSLTPSGRYLDAAGLSTVFHMLWTSLFSKKKAILSATYMRKSSLIKQDLTVLKSMIEKGLFKPVIDRSYSLEETADAHWYVETGRKKGNVVLTIN